LATAALATGATPDVAAAISQGEDLFGVEASAGLTPNAVGTSRNGFYASQNPYSFDWNAYQKKVQEDKNSNPDRFKQFESIGGPPVANVGYADGVLYWANKDTKVAKAWQDHLISVGAYQAVDPASGRTNSDGSWTDADSQALSLHLAQVGMADAVWSQDPNIGPQAAQSVKELFRRGGLQWDATQARNALGSTKAFKDTVFNGWLSGNPGTPTQHSINEYMDLYGKDSLPEEVQQLAEPGGVIGLLSSGVHDFFNLADTLDRGLRYLTGNPKPQSLIQTEVNQLKSDHGSGISWLVSSQEARAKYIQEILTPNELATLAPVVSKVAAGTGWFDDAAAFVQQKTFQFQHLLAYSVGDLLTESKNAVTGQSLGINPFDGVARVLSGSSSHDNHGLEDILGQKWMHDNPQMTTVMDVASSFISPDLMAGPVFRITGLTGVVIPGIKVGIGARNPMKLVESVSALGKDELMANGVSWQARDKMNYIFRPKNALQKMAEESIPSLIRNDTLLDAHDRATILGARGKDAIEQLMLQLHNPDGTFRGELTDQQIRDVIFDKSNSLGHAINQNGMFINFKQSLMAVAPQVMSRMSEGQLRKGAILGSWDFGHRAMHFTTDLSTAIDKMKHDAMVWGPQALADIRPFVSQIMVDPTKAEAIAAQAYDAIGKHIPNIQDFNAYLDSHKRSRYEGAIPQSIIGQISVDPTRMTGETGLPTLSRAIQSAIDSQMMAVNKIIDDFLGTVDLWGATTKRYLTSDPVANEAIIKEFRDDKANADVVKEFDATLKDAQHTLAGYFAEDIKKGTPQIEAQIAPVFHAPYSTWEAIAYNSKAIRNAEWLQNKIKADAMMDLWRTYAIASPKTALRVVFGDDMLRWITTLSFAGSARAAAGAAIHHQLRTIVMSPAMAAWMLGMGFSKSIFGLTSHLSELGVKAFKKHTQGMSQEEVDALVSGWYTTVRQRLETVGGIDMKGLLNQGNRQKHFHPVFVNDKEHRPALEEFISKGMTGSRQRAWAQEFARTSSEEKAKQALLVERVMTDDPMATALAHTKGASQQDMALAQAASEHVANLIETETQLEELENQFPKYTSGPRKGQPKVPPKEYQNLYLKLPKLTTPNKSEEYGSYRDRVIERIKYHEEKSTQAIPQSLKDQVEREHAFYMMNLPLPELRQMAAAGKVDHNVLNSMYKDPVKRQQMPWIVAMTDSKASRFAMINPKKWGEVLLEHMFQPMVVGARADGMLRIKAWYEDYLNEYYKGEATWDAGRIERTAQEMALDWLRNNTYQGTRTIASYALRNTFPFVGSTFNQDKFWINTFKTHPWMAGLAIKAGIDIDVARRQHHLEYPVPDPLHWAGVAGDVIGVNPLGFTFVGNEGMGSVVPQMGPLAMTFAMIAANDAGIRRVMDVVPGWTDYMPQQMTLPDYLSQAIPSYMRKPVAGLILEVGSHLGVHADTLGAITGSGKAITERAKYLESQGIHVTDQQVIDDVAKTDVEQGVVSWLAPVAPRIYQPTMDLITKAATESQKSGATPAQLAKDPRFKDISAYLTYIDPTTDPKVKDQITTLDPSITALAAPTHVTGGTSSTEKPASLHDYLNLAMQGAEHLMVPSEIDRSVHDALQNQQFFRAFDVSVRLPRQAFLVDNNVSTGSTLYKKYYADTLKPREDAIATIFPDAYKKFIQASGTAQLNELTTSESIGSIDAMVHLPPFAEFDNVLTNKWRDVMDLVHQTESNLLELRNSGATQPELQAAAEEFHQALLIKYGNDQSFLNQVGILYHWSSWRDFMSKEVLAQYKAQ
jgi:hypothetical protein